MNNNPSTTVQDRISASIQQARQTGQPLFSVFYTAGYPNLDDTVAMAAELEAAGADMLEIGMPYSDPLADGPVIQHSSEVALANGMTIDLLFEQLKELRNQVQLPVLLMGYFNPMLQYGLDKFEQKAIELGIDGLIVPDMPLEQLSRRLEKPWASQLKRILLVSPQTDEARIRQIDRYASGFIYVVSSASITGGSGPIQDAQVSYFQRLTSMNLNNDLMVGFGISTAEAYQTAGQYASGAIVGSAFIRHLMAHKKWQGTLGSFVNTFKRNQP